MPPPPNPPPHPSPTTNPLQLAVSHKSNPEYHQHVVAVWRQVIGLLGKRDGVLVVRSMGEQAGTVHQHDLGVHVWHQVQAQVHTIQRELAIAQLAEWKWKWKGGG